MSRGILYANEFIIGIDPGLSMIGYGIYHLYNGLLIYSKHGTIRTTNALSLCERLSFIYNSLTNLLLPFDKFITKIYIEQTFHSSNTKTINAVNYAIGVTLLSIRDFKYEFIYPSSIKKFFGLKGGKNKKNIFLHMSSWIQTLNGKGVNKNDDAIDGLAIGLFGFFKVPEIRIK